MVDIELSKHARKFIFDYFLENCRAPVLEEIMQRFRLNREGSFSLLKELESSRHILLLPGTQRILMANPFSSITTPFVSLAGGKKYFANCAWDAIALHVMLGQDVEVESFCHHCAEPVRIHLSQGRVVSSRPESPLVFLSVPAAKWFDNLVNTCSNNMVFHSSKEHLNQWLARNPGLSGEQLTIAKTIELSAGTYKGRMNLDYARPPRDQLMKYWDSIGLHGDFWKL